MVAEQDSPRNTGVIGSIADLSDFSAAKSCVDSTGGSCWGKLATANSADWQPSYTTIIYNNIAISYRSLQQFYAILNLLTPYDPV